MKPNNLTCPSCDAMVKTFDEESKMLREKLDEAKDILAKKADKQKKGSLTRAKLLHDWMALYRKNQELKAKIKALEKSRDKLAKRLSVQVGNRVISANGIITGTKKEAIKSWIKWSEKEDG